MGLLDLLRSRTKAAAPAVSALAVHTQSLYGKPPRKGTREILAAFRASPWLRSVAGKIATGTATIPLTLSQRRGSELKPLEQHPVLDLLRKPNPHMTGRKLRRQVQIGLELTGESFLVKERNLAGVPVELYYVPAHWVSRTPTPTEPTFLINYPAGPRAVPEADVVWLRDHDALEPYGRGSGIAAALSDEIDTDEYASRQTAAFFYNGMVPGTLVSMEGATKAQAEALKEEMEAAHRGYWNAFRAFFTGSKVSINRLDTSFKDMQLVELRRFLRDVVVHTWGVPPEILGIIENSNRSTIDAADYLFAKYVLETRIEDIVEALQNGLVDEFGDDLVLGYVSPVPADKEFALKAMGAHPTAYRVNEVRALTEHQPVPDDEDESLLVAPAPFSLEPGKGGDPAWARNARRSLPGGRRKDVFESDIDNVLERLRPERLTAEVDPVFARHVDEWAQRILDELGQGARFDLLNPLIAEHLREFSAERISGLVNDTTRQALREVLIEGVRAGEDIDELSKRVKDIFTFASEARAETIARTEVIRSSNWATTEAHRISGVVEEREWVATRGDGRTRDSHLRLDGQKVGIDEKFRVDGQSADHPGGFGVAKLDINCRCTTVAVISDDFDDEDGAIEPIRSAGETRTEDDDANEKRLDAIWRKFDQDVRPWESDTEAALRRGFAAQERDLLEALEALR